MLAKEQVLIVMSRINGPHYFLEGIHAARCQVALLCEQIVIFIAMRVYPHSMYKCGT